MRRIELDFVRDPAPARWPQAVLVVLALAFAADVGHRYLALRDSVADAEHRLARRGRAVIDAAPVTVAYTDAEFAAARSTIRRIALPWEGLFAAIETARTEGTALLAIEPDAETGTLLLTGEARDYLRLLNYVSALGASAPLRNVQLSRHAAIAGHPQRALAFSIPASWSAER